MKIRLLIFSLYSTFCAMFAWSQTEPSKAFSLMFGYGNFAALETYLSPYEYSGANYRLMMDASKLRSGGTVLRQHSFQLDYGQLTNFSGRGLYHSAFLDYNYGLHYRALQSDGWAWMMGPSVNTTLGAIYNVRNENNPVQVKAMVNLNYSSVTEYRFRIKSFPLAIQYQLRIPVAGVGFAPDYGASYYEMFQLGNTAGIVHFLSLHNQWAMQNRLTLNIPYHGNTWKLGYYNSFYQTRINHLETSLTAHNFAIGFSGSLFNLSGAKK